MNQSSRGGENCIISSNLFCIFISVIITRRRKRRRSSIYFVVLTNFIPGPEVGENC